MRKPPTAAAGGPASLIRPFLPVIRRFPEDPKFGSFYASADQFYAGPAKCWITHLHQLEVVLFHRGQVGDQPRKLMPSWKPPMTLPPALGRRLGEVLDPAQAVIAGDVSEDGAGGARVRPVARPVLEPSFGKQACQLVGGRTCPATRSSVPATRAEISGLSQFFRDTAVWQYPLRPDQRHVHATTEVVPSSWQRGGPFSLAGDISAGHGNEHERLALLEPCWRPTVRT